MDADGHPKWLIPTEADEHQRRPRNSAYPSSSATPTATAIGAAALASAGGATGVVGGPPGLGPGAGGLTFRACACCTSAQAVWSRATTLVWLDYSFHLVFWRVFRRTMLRAILRQELWNGNREKLWWHFFTKQSLFLWVIQTYWKRQKSIPAAYCQPEYAHLKVLRFRSPRETRQWLAEMISGRL